VVFGMPKEAIEIGAVHEVAPLSKLAGMVINHFSKHAVSIRDGLMPLAQPTITNIKD